MIGVIDIRGLEDLEPYRGAWDDLRSQTRVAEHVPTWDQLVAWQPAAGSEQDMRVQIVVMRGNVVGIWPLVVRRLRTQIGVVRSLTSIFSGCGIWQGPIGPNLAASLHSVMHHLRSVVPDWDVFEFSQILADSRLLKRLITALEAQGFQPQRQRGHDIGMIDLSGGSDVSWPNRLQSAQPPCREPECGCVGEADTRYVSYSSEEYTLRHAGPRRRLLDRMAQWPPLGRIDVQVKAQPMETASVRHRLLESFLDSGTNRVRSVTRSEFHGMEVAGQLRAAAVIVASCGQWRHVWLGAEDEVIIPVLMRRILENLAQRGDDHLWMDVVHGWGLQDWCTTTLSSCQIRCYRMSIRSQLLRWNRKISRMFNRCEANLGAISSASGNSDQWTASTQSGRESAIETSDRGPEGATVRSLSHLRIYTEFDSVGE